MRLPETLLWAALFIHEVRHTGGTSSECVFHHIEHVFLSHRALRLLPDRLALDAMAASLRNSPMASETSTTVKGRVLIPHRIFKLY